MSHTGIHEWMIAVRLHKPATRTHMQVLGTQTYDDYGEALRECCRLYEFTGRHFTVKNAFDCVPYIHEAEIRGMP